MFVRSSHTSFLTSSLRGGKDESKRWTVVGRTPHSGHEDMVSMSLNF
jgi:hypothetical protein